MVCPLIKARRPESFNWLVIAIKLIGFFVIYTLGFYLYHELSQYDIP